MRDANMITLGLGTVQLGLPYGGKLKAAPSEEEVFEILQLALDSGIRFLDTARAYGESESRIGRFLEQHRRPEDLQISTKIPRTNSDVWSDADRFRLFVRNNLLESLQTLGLKQISLL